MKILFSCIKQIIKGLKIPTIGYLSYIWGKITGSPESVMDLYVSKKVAKIVYLIWEFLVAYIFPIIETCWLSTVWFSELIHVKPLFILGIPLCLIIVFFSARALLMVLAYKGKGKASSPDKLDLNELDLDLNEGQIYILKNYAKRLSESNKKNAKKEAKEVFKK